jgi:hypothetical protein
MKPKQMFWRHQNPQEGIPAMIRGWRELLILLAKLVEAEIPD